LLLFKALLILSIGKLPLLFARIWLRRFSIHRFHGFSSQRTCCPSAYLFKRTCSPISTKRSFL